MSKSPTLTLKIINDQDIFDTFPKEKSLSENQKELIRLVTREAVQEYIKATKFQQEENHPDRILRLPEVARMIGVGRSSIYKYVQTGDFPKPLSLEARSVGWKESQITAWLNARPASCSK
jgi:prophage regulatory protein